MSNILTVTRKLTDLVQRERMIRAHMRTPIGRDQYQRYERELEDIEDERARLEEERDRLEAHALSRGLYVH